MVTDLKGKSSFFIFYGIIFIAAAVFQILNIFTDKYLKKFY